jgi:GntR family transcriptional regulator
MERHATDPSKTQKVYLVLRDRIVSGEWTAGERLSGEPALAQEFDVSRVTVRRALARLVEEGLVERRAGSGTFVRGQRRRVGAVITDVANVFSGLIAMGRATDVRLLSFEYVRPPGPVREALGLSDGELVQRSVRVRLVDGVPFSHLTAHVPERIGRVYSEADLARSPLLELMERTGLALDHARQEISAVLAGPEVSEALAVDTGAPLVALTRVVYGPNGEGMEHLSALYHPERYTLRMDLVRSGGTGGPRWRPSDTGEPMAEGAQRERARAARKA